MEPKRLHGLDALRGIAALAVVVWHWQHFFALPGGAGTAMAAQPFFAALKPLYVQGWAAVDLFFVLSGFVFFWLYGDAIRARAVGGWRFALLRFSRLYPLHLVMLVAVAAMQLLYVRGQGAFFVYPDNDAAHFAANLFLVQTWWPRSAQSFDGPAWSVSIEMLLYVVFFVACRLGLKRGLHCLMLALLGGLLLPFDEHIGRGVIGFFMGGVAFAAWEQLRGEARARAVARALGATALLAWSVLALLLYRDALPGGEGNTLFLLAFDFVLCPLTVLALALREQGAFARLSFLGDLSYSTYLLHFPLQLLLALGAAPLALTPAFFLQGWVMLAFYAVLIAVGWASYRCFERPLQSLLRNYAKNTVAAWS